MYIAHVEVIAWRIARCNVVNAAFQHLEKNKEPDVDVLSVRGDASLQVRNPHAGRDSQSLDMDDIRHAGGIVRSKESG